MLTRIAVGTLLSAAAVFVATLVLGGGGSARHAWSHLIGAAVASLVAAAVARAWRRCRSRLEAAARFALVLTLAAFAAAQTAEAIGTFAWAANGVTIRSSFLLSVHDAAIGATVIALALVAVSVAVALACLAWRLRSARAVATSGSTRAARPSRLPPSICGPR